MSEMNVLVVDADSERRDVVADALSWIANDYRLFEARDLAEARDCLKRFDFRLVIVGPELPCDTRAALVFLRGSLPHSALLTCMKMSSFDRDGPTRMLDCGADLVFDQRMSATQLSLVLRPYRGHQVNPEDARQVARDWVQPALTPA